MSTHYIQSTHDSDDSWHDIQDEVSELAALSRANLTFDEFVRKLLSSTLRILGAHGGAVWVRGPQSDLRLQYQINLTLLSAERDSVGASARSGLLKEVMRTREAGVVPLLKGSAAVEASEEASGLLLACPCLADTEIIGLVEVIQRTISPAAQRGNLRLLSIICDLIADFLCRRQVRELVSVDKQWRKFELLVQHIHADLNLEATAFQLVNEGRTFIGCDRVSLVVRRFRKLRTLAVSGVDSFDRRSKVVRGLEKLAEAVLKSGQPLHYDGPTDHLPPQLEMPLGAYVDLAHVRSLDAVPLRPPASTAEGAFGVLLIEQFEAKQDSALQGRITRVCTQGALALRNAMDYDSLPFLPVARGMRGWFGAHTWPRWSLAIGLWVMLAVLLCCVRAELRIQAEGKLQPVRQRDVYAPLDAEVVEVPGQHDSDVKADEILVVLHSQQIDLDLQRIQGDYQTTQKKLLAVTSARVRLAPEESTGGSLSHQWAAEEQELKQLLASQEKQLNLLRQQRDQLVVRSPIDGRVLTWNLRELLEDRPVQRGQMLVAVADVQGPWMIDLQLPDRHMGHVLAAQSSSEEPIEVTFCLATDRGTSYHGQVQKIAGRTDSNQDGPPIVRVIAGIGDLTAEGLRPGATVYAKLHCGTKSLGYVWLHDLLDTGKAWLFF